MAANKAFVSDNCSFIPFQNRHKNSKESVHTYNSRRVVKNLSPIKKYKYEKKNNISQSQRILCRC